MITKIRNEDEYEAALDEANCFDHEPGVGTAEAARFDQLALLIDD